MGLMVATKAFFKLLTDGELSKSYDDFASGKLSPPALVVAEANQNSGSAEGQSPKSNPNQKPESSRSDAISLLSALQREARFVDLIKESLDGYSDAQIGAAARDVIRDCGDIVDRMFAIEPLSDVQDGQILHTAAEFDPAEYRFTGNVTGEPPFQGTLTHHGWKATKCEVPEYNGSASSALIVAPTEMEIK